MRDKDEARFRSKYVVGDDCWQWVGGVDSKGYGRFSISLKYYRAHRVAYELLVGPIPEGLVIDHLCRNKLCVNPAHMEPVTQAVNASRGFTQLMCGAGLHYLADESSTFINKDGRRRCRHCHNERQKKWHRARAAAARA